MKVPGVFWTVALVGLPLISAWLVQYFPAAVWAAPVAALLLIIVKVVQVLHDAQPKSGPEGLMLEAKPKVEHGAFYEIMVG